MLKSFPVYFMICSVVAINISAFLVVLYMGLFETSVTTKTVTWLLTICAWAVTYLNRNR